MTWWFYKSNKPLCCSALYTPWRNSQWHCWRSETWRIWAGSVHHLCSLPQTDPASVWLHFSPRHQIPSNEEDWWRSSHTLELGLRTEWDRKTQHEMDVGQTCSRYEQTEVSHPTQSTAVSLRRASQADWTPLWSEAANTHKFNTRSYLLKSDHSRVVFHFLKTHDKSKGRDVLQMVQALNHQSEKRLNDAHLLITVWLQVRWILDQAVFKATVIALIQTLTARFMYERHQVHLKTHTIKLINQNYWKSKTALTP